MTAVGRWRATYAPGDWLVLCGPTSLVVLEPPGDGWTPLAGELWEQVLASSSLRDLAARMARYGLDTMPSFAALFWAPEGMRSLVRGTVRLLDPASGRMVADGRGVQTWSEVGLTDLRTVRLDTATAPAVGSLHLPLVVGAVRASSVLLDARPQAQVHSVQLDLSGQPAPPPGKEPPTGSPPPTGGAEPGAAPPAGSGPLAETQAMAAPGTVREVRPSDTVLLPDLQESADTELVGVAAPGPASPAALGAPSVPAVFCPQGHPNPPGNGRCRDCGVAITDARPRLATQPALATLRVSDGTQLTLDRVVLIGRAPTHRGDPAVGLLTVPSPSHDISRTHLEVRPDGWRVLVRDLHSTNGTILVSPDGSARFPLPAGESVPVRLGSVLELADGVSVLLDLPQ